MTLAGKLKKSACDRRYYRHNRVGILERKRITNATKRYARSLQRAIESARDLLVGTP